jgi:general secretion pathway protein L
LRRALPNIVEEHLIQDAQRSHIAVAPEAAAGASADAGSAGERYAAVIERDWFAAVVDRFLSAGHRKLRAVPLLHCIPLHDGSLEAQSSHANDRAQSEEGAPGQGADQQSAIESEPPQPLQGDAKSDADTSGGVTASALIVRHASRKSTPIAVTPTAEFSEDTPPELQSTDSDRIEIAVRQGSQGFGMTIHAEQLDTTIAELAKRQPLVVYSLAIDASSGSTNLEPQFASTTRSGSNASQPPNTAAFPLAALTLPWPTVARNALACRFDLCQFELATNARARAGSGGLKPWRFALGFIAASLVVSLIAVNVQWYQSRKRSDALNAQMTQLVKAAFPDATVILDPHAQMSAGLARLRSAAGELRTDDFPALAAGVSRALSPIPSDAIAGLDYSGSALDVTFKPGTTIDSDALTHRLAAQGLSAQEDNGKWSIRSAQRPPR